MTSAAISALVSSRLNEAGAPKFYPAAEILAATNEGQRLFALLTLCLERTYPLLVPANTTFLHVLPQISDYIAPLRITDINGAKVRPARFSDLWALDSSWPATVGPTTRYAAAGADLVGLYGQLATPQVLTLQYAGSPALLLGDGDTPQIPAEYHQELVNYGIYRCRMVEGGEEFASTLPLLEHVLQSAEDYGEFIRSRNIGFGYDSLPFELASFDRSRLVGRKKGK